MITQNVESYLKDVVIPLRLSCTTQSGWPMVLSLWYLYENGRLYCATQQTAKVVGYLGSDDRCAFEVAADQPPYCGVRGQAKGVVDNTKGAEILERLLYRYLGDIDNPLAKKLLAKRDTEVAIILEPVTFFTWNYAGRMASVADNLRKPCP